MKNWTPEKLKNGRLAKGLTQKQLGGMTGYTAMAISHFEKATRPIPARLLFRLDGLLDNNARPPRFSTVHSPKMRQRTERYTQVVKDFETNGFTHQQADFLVGLLDSHLPII